MGYEEEEYSTAFDLKIWKKLFPYLAPYRRTVWMVFVLNLFCTLVDILLPLFQQYAIDHFIAGHTLEGLPAFALTYALALSLQTLSVIVFTRGCMRIEMYLGRDLKRACFVHLQTLSFSYYNVTPVGYLLTRVMSDTDRISSLVAWNVVDLMWAAVYVLGVFAAMFLLNVRLALIVMLVLPAIVLLTWFFQNRILHWNRLVRRTNSRITGAFNEGIMGAKTSKTLVIEEKNDRNFKGITLEMKTSAVHAARLGAVYISLVLMMGAVATALVLDRGGNLVVKDMMMLGTLSAFTTYAVGIFEPIQHLAANFSEVIAVQTNIARVAGLLEKKPAIVDAPEVVEKYGDTFHPRTENW